MIRFLLLAFISLSLAACGLSPMHSASAARGSLYGAVQIDPIEGRAGWLLHNALGDRLGEAGSNARYRLQIVLDENITGSGTRGDDSIVRERRTLRARYRLYDNGSGAILYDGTAGSDAGIDVVTSEYATIAAEQTALENLAVIVARDIAANLGMSGVAGGDAPSAAAPRP